jgi:hypothetical protein
VNKYDGLGENLFPHLQVQIYLFFLRLKAAIACESMIPVYKKHAVTNQNTFIYAVSTVRTSPSHRPAQKQTTVADLNVFL